MESRHSLNAPDDASAPALIYWLDIFSWILQNNLQYSVAFRHHWAKVVASLFPHFATPYEKAYSDSSDSRASGFA
jgi:hypothetical protein